MQKFGYVNLYACISNQHQIAKGIIYTVRCHWASSQQGTAHHEPRVRFFYSQP